MQYSNLLFPCSWEIRGNTKKLMNRITNGRKPDDGGKPHPFGQAYIKEVYEAVTQGYCMSLNAHNKKAS